MLPRSISRLVARTRRPVCARPAARPAVFLQAPGRPFIRSFATQKSADDTIEELQEQYGLAKDEFEIAQEETDKVSVYAEDDRRAAREELDKLEDMYKEAAEDPHIGQEVQGRVGQRIRELATAVHNMEEQAQNQD